MRRESDARRQLASIIEKADECHREAAARQSQKQRHVERSAPQQKDRGAEGRHSDRHTAAARRRHAVRAAVVRNVEHAVCDRKPAREPPSARTPMTSAAKAVSAVSSSHA
jgi:hypothetical protein